MLYNQRHNYTQNANTEHLFLNTIPFEFPSEPVKCWFTKEKIKGNHLKQIGLKNRPLGIDVIFPGIGNEEMIYTSFDEEYEGMVSLDIDLSNHKNYYFAKRWYNGIINHHFKSRGFAVETNQITKDNQIWVYDRNGNKRKDCWQFDRFTLKIDWDDFNKHPQLVLSYDRPALIYRKSIAQLLDQQSDPFDSDAKDGFTLSLVKKVYFKYKREDGNTAQIIDKYEFLTNNKNFSNKSAYPKMWPRLADYVGLPEQEADNDEVYTTRKRKIENRYKKYYEKINFFYKYYLNTDEFRAKIAIDKNGFAWANKLQIGRTASCCQELVFGGGVVDFNPQSGINNGPLEAPKQTNIQLMFIFHQDDVAPARDLLKFFLREGYKNFFKGLAKYTGKAVTNAPKAFHLQFQNRENPLPEIEQFLCNLNKEEGVTYLAIYLTPHSKHTMIAAESMYHPYHFEMYQS